MRPELYHKTTKAGESEGCESLCSTKHDQSFGKMSNVHRNVGLLRVNIFLTKTTFAVTDQGFSVGGRGRQPPARMFSAKMYAKTKELGPIDILIKLPDSNLKELQISSLLLSFNFLSIQLSFNYLSSGRNSWYEIQELVWCWVADRI